MNRKNVLESPPRRQPRRVTASQDPATALARTSPEVQRLVNELRLHQAELEAQNEELRTAQAALATSSERITDLYDFAPVGYATIALDGGIQRANLTLCRMLGRERYQVEGADLSRFVAWDSQDRLHLHLVAARKGTLERRLELVLQRADKSEFPAQLESAYSLDDATGQRTCRIALSDITERKQAERAVQTSLREKEGLLREKEVLLREVHHCVKNNLQVISSLISLQSDRLPDQARAALSDLRDRVHAMALVHDRLHAAQSLAQVDFAGYASGLLGYLFRMHGELAAQVRLSLAVQPVVLPVDTAVHCGLILNELVSNALKHAFPPGHRDTACEILVALERDDASGEVCLRVRDNGIGPPPGLDWQVPQSLGLRLVRTLIRQLRGTATLHGEHGTEIRVRIPASATASRK